MSKKTSLADAVKQSAAPAPIPIRQDNSSRTHESRSQSYQPPSRRGKKAITVHFDPAVIKQLKQIGLELDRPTQDMMAEALNDFFTKLGKSPLAS